jgi:hypothetical protein
VALPERQGIRPSGFGFLSAFGLVPLCLGLTVFAAIAAEKNPNSACLDCHSDKTLTKTNAAGKEVSLFVDEAKLHKLPRGRHLEAPRRQRRREAPRLRNVP